MKSTNRTIYYQWFVIAMGITLLCIALGMFITHVLTKRDEDNRRERLRDREEVRIFAPEKKRSEILTNLIATGKLSAEEAFEIVDLSHKLPFPAATYLVDEERKTLIAHESKSFNRKDASDFVEFKVSENRFVKYYDNRDPIERHGPRHGGPRGRGGPPPGARLIILSSIGLSVAVGIALSIFLLTFYLRKRAKNVEEVLSKLKSGDLKARFPIGQTDEAGLLMMKFNDMAQDIETLVENLRNTEESRKKLLQELAHDLRTPVASMKNLQETLFLKGHLLDPERKEQLEKLAMKEVSYFERLVEDLLFLSGVNDPRYSQQLKNIPLSDLMNSELDVFESDRVSLRFESLAGIVIRGDEHLLRRLLKNALSNATRHASTHVLVKITRHQGLVHLSIQNDGPGLPEAELADFGEKKFSRKILDDGTGHISVGLGSVIMKKIMTLHNGSLAIRNTHPGVELILTFQALEQ